VPSRRSVHAEGRRATPARRSRLDARAVPGGVPSARAHADVFPRAQRALPRECSITSWAEEVRAAAGRSSHGRGDPRLSGGHLRLCARTWSVSCIRHGTVPSIRRPLRSNRTGGCGGAAGPATRSGGRRSPTGPTAEAAARSARSPAVPPPKAGLQPSDRWPSRDRTSPASCIRPAIPTSIRTLSEHSPTASSGGCARRVGTNGKHESRTEPEARAALSAGSGAEHDPTLG
jgi:hypothetical protein